MKQNYIAYGSNLNVKQMQRRCPTARILGTSVIQGWRLMFKGSKTGAYLTIEPEEGCTVPVAVWTVEDGDVAVLDRYEGYPNFYYKRDMVLTATDIWTGEPHRSMAFFYAMYESRPFGIPSDRYVQTCADGYRYFGFDLDALAEAIVYSKKRKEKSR